MGTICSRDIKPKNELPDYETLFSEAEKELILPTLEIRSFQSEIAAAEFSDGTFDSRSIAKLFRAHGVSDETFAATDSVFQYFFADLADTDPTSFRNYLLMSCLPLCKGSGWEKKEVLWQILGPQDGFVELQTLLGVVNTIIVLSTRTLAEFLLNHEQIHGRAAAPDVLLFSKCDDSQVEAYAEQYRPKMKLREPEKMHRYEFDQWMLETDASSLFSSRSHRQTLYKLLTVPLSQSPPQPATEGATGSTPAADPAPAPVPSPNAN